MCHLDDVASKMLEACELSQAGKQAAKNCGLTKQQFEQLAYVTGWCHDFGKVTPYFQVYLKTHKRTQESQHSLLGAWASMQLFQENSKEAQLCKVLAFYAIRHHHTQFHNKDEALEIEGDEDFSYESFRKMSEAKKLELQCRLLPDGYALWKYGLKRYEEKTGGKITNPRFIAISSSDKTTYLRLRTQDFTDSKRILLEWLYAQLILCDRSGAAKINFSQHEKIWKTKDIDEHVEKLPKNEDLKTFKLNKIRTQFFKIICNTLLPKNSRIFTLTAPTGVGKTLSGFRLALSLRKPGNRIVYCLPFTSIIDQTYEEFKKMHSDGDSLLPSHYASKNPFEENPKTSEYTANQLDLRAKAWDSEVIITTFVQLFELLNDYSPQNALRLANLEGAVIILDEAQALPFKYWNFVALRLKELSQTWNWKIILMTATQPHLFNSKDAIEVIPQNEQQALFSAINRYVLNYSGALEVSYICKQIIASDSNAAIIVNTKKSAQQVFDELTKIASTEVVLMFLSTGVIAKTRAKRIKEIKGFFKEQHTSKTKKLILVSTQLIEAGVDLDFPKIWRELAPLDSLVQAAGRCNRNAGMESNPIVEVFSFSAERNHSQVYGATEISLTREFLAENLQENQVRLKISEYYHKLIERKDQESVKLIENLRNWQFDLLRKDSLIDEAGCTIIIPEQDMLKMLYSKKSEIEKNQLVSLFQNTASITKGDLEKLRKNGAIIEFNEEQFGSSFNVLTQEAVNKFYDKTKGMVVS